MRLPAIEIVAMDALINAFGRRGPEADAYKVNGTVDPTRRRRAVDHRQRSSSR
jgi:hypothetical protein